MAPPYVNEDPNLESVRDGMEAAENDTRDAVTDSYQTAALESDNPEEQLDDIDYTLSDSQDTAPEIGALHEIAPDDLD